MPRNDLDQALADLQVLCKKMTTGTAERPRTTRVIDLALQHMLDWADTRPPPLHSNGPRGGTTTTTAHAERFEDHELGRHAAHDHAQALILIRTITVATEQLYLLGRRYTAPIDTSKLPKPADTIPGCVSCARTKKKGPLTLGGHFSPVSERPAYQAKQLCRWCGDHDRVGSLPPVEAIDIYHRQGPQAAGRWLAQQQRRPTSRKAS